MRKKAIAAMQDAIAAANMYAQHNCSSSSSSSKDQIKSNRITKIQWVVNKQQQPLIGKKTMDGAWWVII